MGALIGTIAPFLFRQVERMFRPKTGDAKMGAVMDAVKAIVGRLATAGEAPALPPDGELRAILEDLLKQEKGAATWREKGTLSHGGKRYIVEIIEEL